MTNILNTLLFSSFIIGFLHSLEIDHIVTVSNFAMSKNGWLKGVLWGLGHSLIVIGVGLLFSVFNFILPENISDIFELLVAIVLIILALVNIRWLVFIRKNNQHTHTHIINGKEIIHSHQESIKADYSLLQIFMLGLAHGLAGSSALIVLIAPKINDIRFTLIYLFMFSVGVILGMGFVSVVLSRIMNINIFSKYKIEYILRVIIVVLGLYYGVGGVIRYFGL